VSLEIKGSKVEVLPAQLVRRFPAMKEFTIDFSQINIGKIDDQLLKYMTPLKKLDLNSNELTEIDEHAFSGLGNLEVIILRNNKLERIPLNLFSGNGGLKEIDLRSNKLSKIHYGSFQFYSLETLLLSYKVLSVFKRLLI
jgi:Leucine-rich repeat (LRR) protein